MSRTIRRKNYVPEWITHEWVRIPTGYLAWTQKYYPDREYGKRWERGIASYEAHISVRVPLEGKALKKALAKHHGDHGYIVSRANGVGCPKDFRQAEQRKYRAQCRNELHKALQNEDYEVMILANPKLPYWD